MILTLSFVGTRTADVEQNTAQTLDEVESVTEVAQVSQITTGNLYNSASHSCCSSCDRSSNTIIFHNMSELSNRYPLFFMQHLSTVLLNFCFSFKNASVMIFFRTSDIIFSLFPFYVPSLKCNSMPIFRWLFLNEIILSY